MRLKKEILNPEKTIGPLPGWCMLLKHKQLLIPPVLNLTCVVEWTGIDVGYQFYSRAEMVAVGFHGHWLNGIDYIGKSKGEKVMSFRVDGDRFEGQTGHSFPVSFVS